MCPAALLVRRRHIGIVAETTWQSTHLHEQQTVYGAEYEWQQNCTAAIKRQSFHSSLETTDWPQIGVICYPFILKKQCLFLNNVQLSVIDIEHWQMSLSRSVNAGDSAFLVWELIILLLKQTFSWLIHSLPEFAALCICCITVVNKITVQRKAQRCKVSWLHSHLSPATLK